jgi:uncharacterized membrane protein
VSKSQNDSQVSSGALTPRVQALVRVVEAVAGFITRHWLALLNLGMGIFAFGPFLSPLLMATGHPIWGRAIFLGFGLTGCHQLPSRSWFLFGYQVALCQRDVAFYGSFFLGGLLFALHRQLRPLNWRLFLLAVAPMAVDGLTQLVGWRESTWLLRSITGALFGFSSVWLLYPRLEQAMREVQATLQTASAKS